jgi:hypothetical protein
MAAAAARLDRQLNHERRLRDLDHMRAVLAESVSDAIRTRPVADLRRAVSELADGEQRQSEALGEAQAATDERIGVLMADVLRLLVAVGPESPAVKIMQRSVTTLQAASDVVSRWQAGEQLDVVPEFESHEYEHVRTVGAFLNAANATAGTAAMAVTETGTSSPNQAL